MSDGELAARLLATPTGCCTSLAYALFRKYKSPRDPVYGPFDDEVIANLRQLAGDRVGETPEQILNRLAVRLNCEPRQVADRVIRMLEERAKQQ